LTKAETVKVLAILKAAYPNTFKSLSAEDAKATVNVWAAQFANMPVDVVMIALNKLISTNTFPPSIVEVKERIRSLYWEAWTMIDQHNKGLQVLDEKTLARLRQVLEAVEPMRTMQRLEPSLGELLGGYAQYLTDGT
jgi:hypothetical protein